jgi:hypothetical protein
MSGFGFSGGAGFWGPAGLGVLAAGIGPGLVDEVVDLAGCREKRCRLLPARAVVYFVLGLCLFSGADSAGPPGYRSVWRWLTGGVRHLHGLALPTSAALSRARQRLGAKPLELLFERCRGPVAGAGTPGALAFGLRLVAWDGTGIDAAQTPGNVAAFGVTPGGDPQLRLLAVTECGTHAVVDAAFDGRERASEQELARRVIASLGPGMLLLADRNFPGYELWGLAAATGAHLAWRIKKNLVLPPLKVLPDGSYLSVMRTPAANKRVAQARYRGRAPASRQDGHLVRVTDFAVTVTSPGGGTRTESFRLVTTLLDHELAPAAELAAIYHERWEAENGYGELKSRLRGTGFTLRSKTPEMVRQELWAFLVIYQALCALRAEAAATAGIDPDRLSFTVTIRTARATTLTRNQAIADILADPLPPRRNRQCPRTKKPPRNNYPHRKRDQPLPPAAVTYAITITAQPQLPATTP